MTIPIHVTNFKRPTYFTKMHSLGNDFVIINSVDIPNHDFKSVFSESQIKALADRHTGIGFDQLLLISSTDAAEQFYCHIYNADGRPAEQCGNGLRCIARLLYEQRQCGRDCQIETKAGVFRMHIVNDHLTSMTMGIPTIAEKLFQLREDIAVSLISLGNPHAIFKVTAIDDASALQKANYIYHHQNFPAGINVGMMQVLGPQHVLLRTLERGSGETLACGSNACAAACAGIINQWVGAEDELNVEFALGCLQVAWEGIGKAIKLTGPTQYVYSGLI